MKLEICGGRVAVVGIVFLLALVGASSSRAVTTVYSSGNIAVPIPDNSPTGASVTINVPDIGTVTDVNVRVRLDHGSDGDIAIGLSHSNSGNALSNNNGGSGANYGSGSNDCSGTKTVFDDSAATLISAGTAPFAGSFKPQSGLSIHNGAPVQGAWTVTVVDSVAGTAGTIGCVELEITYANCTVTCPANITVSNDNNQCGGLVNYPAPTTTGTCGTITCTPTSGSFFPVGSGTSVTCTENPAAGGVGATCSFSVTVNDTQVPFVGQPANLTVVLGENQTQTVVNFPPAAAGDNCPGVTVAATPPSGSIFQQGTTTVTVTATDTSGNSSSTTFLVQVVAFLKVPTMSEAALIVLALLLMGIVALRRSRRI